jgi:hypothetical protein
MGTVRSLTSINFYQITRRHIWENNRVILRPTTCLLTNFRGYSAITLTSTARTLRIFGLTNRILTFRNRDSFFRERNSPVVTLSASSVKQVSSRTILPEVLDRMLKIGIVEGGVQLGPLGTAATNRPIAPAPGDYDDGEIGGMMIGRGNPSTRRKPAPVQLCPPQTPHACPDANPGSCGEKPATNRLSYCTALDRMWLPLFIKFVKCAGSLNTQ